MTNHRMGQTGITRVVGLVLAATLLSGCEEMPNGLFAPAQDTETETETPPPATKLIERDVEAPEVFQATEAGLWDGRPSLGGVWVAHPDAADPERVIIRNDSNGKFVIGALFRRERDIPGPRLQASSDAAAALGMLPGAPVQLNVTALRKETVPEEPVFEEPAPEVAAPTTELVDTQEISEETLDPIAAAGAAIEESAVASATAAATTGAVPTVETNSAPLTAMSPEPAQQTAPAASSLTKPYIQIGIFSVEANANGAADLMRDAGLKPTVYAQKSNDKPFWRVVVGPAQTGSERAELLKKIQDVGFTDAYAVTN